LFIVMLTASIACAAATAVTGGYAVWLARHQAARQALTDVNDILRSCQSRMSQLESDLQRLPDRPA
jgi:predicted dienelactone hydrolase